MTNILSNFLFKLYTVKSDFVFPGEIEKEGRRLSLYVILISLDVIGFTRSMKTSKIDSPM